MKLVSGLLSLMLLVSCTDAAPPPPAKSRPKLVTGDTGNKAKEVVQPYAGVDVSPMDMSYLPVDYPKISGRKPTPVARLIYSRPHKQGRKIFGSLVRYGQPWRLGANEATEIEFFIPVKIKGHDVPKGRYVLYCIPFQDKWTIVFNKDLYCWGLNIDQSKDFFRVDIPFNLKLQPSEYFSMIFQETKDGADLVIGWDTLEARLPIQYSKP
jgi:hypothetical protein